MFCSSSSNSRSSSTSWSRCCCVCCWICPRNSENRSRAWRCASWATSSAWSFAVPATSVARSWAVPATSPAFAWAVPPTSAARSLTSDARSETGWSPVCADVCVVIVPPSSWYRSPTAIASGQATPSSGGPRRAALQWRPGRTHARRLHAGGCEPISTESGDGRPRASGRCSGRADRAGEGDGAAPWDDLEPLGEARLPGRHPGVLETGGHDPVVVVVHRHRAARPHPAQEVLEHPPVHRHRVEQHPGAPEVDDGGVDLRVPPRDLVEVLPRQRVARD